MTLTDTSRPTLVVGYTTTHAGADAVALGARLARAIGGRLELVMVLPERGVAVPLDSGYEHLVHDRAQVWLDKVSGQIPDDVPHGTKTRYAEDPAGGLMAAVTETDADYLVVGAADGSLRGRFTLGSVTNKLMHAATVPLVLAPAGSDAVEAPLSRVTAGVGTNRDARALVDATAALAGAAEVPVRLVSLLALDLPAGVDAQVARLATGAHTDELLAQVHAQLPDDLDVWAGAVEGDSIRAVVNQLDWDPGEVMIVGSSRLARPRSLFLGSTAARILRELPVPMIVIPRAAKKEAAS